MYKGFDLKLSELERNNFFWENFNLGEALYSEDRKKIKKTLEFILDSDETIDGSKAQEIWFPQIESDIFISHSHNDIDLAKYLSGWLKVKFGIKSFIDSSLWSDYKTLLSELNEYSWMDKSNKTYYHDKANFAASHAHMMLSTALTMMIDRTECLIFLNTDNSIPSYSKKDQTESPWIYLEISLSKYIEKKTPLRFKFLSESERTFLETKNYAQTRPLKVTYNLDLSHLYKIPQSKLFNLFGGMIIEDKYDALNAFYKLFDQKG